MTIIQQTMDIFPIIRNDPLNAPQSTGITIKQREIVANTAPTKTTGNINVSAFCSQLSSFGIHLGRNQMFKWLRMNGYISKQKSTWNMPLKKYVDQNLFSYKETFVLVADEQIPKYSPLITPKGKAYLAEKLKSKIKCKSNHIACK